MTESDSLIVRYIYMAVGCGAFGLVILFIELLVTQYLGIDVTKHVWLLAIPVILAVSLNVLFIELYRKHRKKKRSS
ncbi:MAG: hypothetical protein HYX79_02195 [Chloroflexi bacterium]|nr:hypothetical protein [Chloroflexota bacterium]